jgi:hypothetical protein
MLTIRALQARRRLRTEGSRLRQRHRPLQLQRAGQPYSRARSQTTMCWHGAVRGGSLTPTQLDCRRSSKTRTPHRRPPRTATHCEGTPQLQACSANFKIHLLRHRCGHSKITSMLLPPGYGMEIWLSDMQFAHGPDRLHLPIVHDAVTSRSVMAPRPSSRGHGLQQSRSWGLVLQSRHE